jgi:homocysteine S-methyltransferase
MCTDEQTNGQGYNDLSDILQDDPLWSARLLRSAPSAIKDVHKSYLASGADIITTASYQARLTFICI